MIAVADGEVLGLVELPIAGLMSDRPVAEVAEQTLALAGRLPAARLGDREPGDDLLVPLARRDPGAAADQPRAGRRRARSSSSRRSWA